MKEIVFNVTVDEANLIFKALGKMPFEQVFELIGKLNDQANEQFQDRPDDTGNEARGN